MGYSKEIYDAAMLVLKNRHEAAERDAEKRTNLLEQTNPRTMQIRYEIAQAGIQVSRAILNGKNAKEEVEKLAVKNLALQKEFSQILSDNLLPHNYTEPWYVCSSCNDTGFIDGRMCSCLKQCMKEESYSRLNVLSNLELADFNFFNLNYYSNEISPELSTSPRQRMQKIFDYCKKYADTFSLNSASILMRGDTGLGKTHLSLAIAKSVIDNGYGVIYSSVHNLTTQLNNEYFGKDNSLNSNKALLECDLLILDDLGTEFITAFVSSSIYNIINTRLMKKKPTIINTNLTMPQIREKYSERVVSRIIGSYTVLSFIGKDIRQIKREEKYNNH